MHELLGLRGITVSSQKGTENGIKKINVIESGPWEPGVETQLSDREVTNTVQQRLGKYSIRAMAKKFFGSSSSGP